MLNDLFINYVIINGPDNYYEELGGIYAGILEIPDIIKYMIIVSPKEVGEMLLTFGYFGTLINNSSWDGLTNTKNLPDSPATNFCLNLDFNGFKDWYLPASDELELIRNTIKAINFSIDQSYWSSSIQNSVYTATTFHFNSSYDGVINRLFPRYTRAIRRIIL